MTEKRNDLTTGKVSGVLVRFALPYLLACFLQTFYGMMDLFVVGMYNQSSTVAAVSIGSQVTHMLTVILVGLAMGTTVMIGRYVGAKDDKEAARVVGTTIALFGGLAVVLTIALFFLTGNITTLMMTPKEAVLETNHYLRVCFLGIPFIISYNIISSIFRGAGDSKRPMYFVGVACVVNIALDFWFVGGLQLGAYGAALATVIAQGVSSAFAFLMLKHRGLGFAFGWKDIRFYPSAAKDIVTIGLPISLQDGLIQVSFIVITIIANNRGLVAATSVGIVEKIICFLFLVPSAFLSAISAVTAQNMGAGKEKRARKTLGAGLYITMSYGFVVALLMHFLPTPFVGLFTQDADVLKAGAQYLSSYGVDVLFASIHFCFSGYFCGIQKSVISFIHNITSILLIRIPGAYLASVLYPDTLYPMGWAAPIGSLLSALICLMVYLYQKRKMQKVTNI